MNLIALLLILISAVIHALWNLLTKQSRDKLSFIWWSMLAILFIYFPLFLWYLRQSSPFLSENWFWPIVSGFFQTAYCVLLAFAYEQGDLSIIYPLSRGSAPIFITIGAILLLDERLSLKACHIDSGKFVLASADQVPPNGNIDFVRRISEMLDLKK